MAVQPRSDSVRPIGVCRRPDRGKGPPQCVVVGALVGIGALLGWLGASLTANLTAGDPQDAAATVQRESLTGEVGINRAVAVRWEEAREVPEIAAGWEIASHSEVVEVGSESCLIVQLRGSTTGEVVTEIWSSADDLTWTSEPLNLGTSIVSPRLSATADGLLLTARIGANDALWRGALGSGTGPVSWSRVALQIPDGLSNQVLTTATADDGNVVAVLEADMNVWPAIISPFVPAPISLDDGSVRYRGDEYLYRVDGGDDIRIFSRRPEVLVANQRVWIRLVTLEGEEIVRTVPLPDGVHSASRNPQLADIEVFAAWASDDGANFTSVAGPDVLPDGSFHPATWGGNFVAAVASADPTHRPDAASELWTAESGTDWQPDPLQPPPECSPFTMVVSGEHLLLTSTEGIQCHRGLRPEWEVLEESCTVCYKRGGPAAFVGYPSDFNYDCGLISQDGVSWSETTLPTVEPYPTLAILADHLVAVSIGSEESDHQGQIRIWRGSIRT